MPSGILVQRHCSGYDIQMVQKILSKARCASKIGLMIETELPFLTSRSLGIIIVRGTVTKEQVIRTGAFDVAKVRWAQERDIQSVKRLADDNRHALGFVVQASLEERARQHGLLVGEHRGEVIGFVSFHHRRDRWTTIRELCVGEKYRRRGVGRALVEAVKDDALRTGQSGIRLKCPLDLPANGFYARLGFTRVALEEGNAVRWLCGRSGF